MTTVQKQPKYEETPRSSYVITLASIADDITPWGQNPHYRDVQLRNFWPTEPYLASAIYDIIIRNASFNWVLDGPPRTVQACQDMLHEADLGKGWLEFIIKFSTDFFTTDNGGFIEVIRDGDSWNAPVAGIAHLDSGRCRRTGVPEWPVVYTDRNGAEHKMAPWQVISRSEFPSPIETMNGVGLSAVSRVLRVAQLMRDISIYKREKVSGRHAGQIHLISGVRSQEIDDAMSQHDEEQIAKGYIRYIKPLIFGTLDPNAKVAHETIDMASLPDGFDEEVTMKWYISLLAMGFGADYQDFAPLPGGGLGSSQQSQILHQKSRGKGPALFMKMLEHAFNFYGVLPRNVTFKYDEQDVAADMEQATLKESRARTRNMYITNGTLTPEAVRQQMLDDKELTQEEFDRLSITPDVTPEVSATDEEPIEETHANEKVKKDFMDEERKKAESSMEKELSKVLKEMYGEFKKRILSKGKALDDFMEKLPFADLINDEELWQLFQVKFLQAVKPYYRKGALEAAAFNESLGLAVNMDLVNDAVLDFTRTYIPKWWDSVAQTTREGFRKAVLDWQSGNLGDQGLDDLVDALEPYFGEARARRIAVTETTKIFDEGNRLARESAGVKYEQWQTARDDALCDACSELDGQFFPLNSGPRPPLHVNCRCSRAPAAEQDVSQYNKTRKIERDSKGNIIAITTTKPSNKSLLENIKAQQANLEAQEVINQKTSELKESLESQKASLETQKQELEKEKARLEQEVSKPQIVRKVVERDASGQIIGLTIIGGEHDS